MNRKKINERQQHVRNIRRNAELIIAAASHDAESKFISTDTGSVVILNRRQVDRIMTGRAKIRDLTGWDPVEARIPYGRKIARSYNMFHLVHLMEWLKLNHRDVYESWNNGGGKEPKL